VLAASRQPHTPVWPTGPQSGHGSLIRSLGRSRSKEESPEQWPVLRTLISRAIRDMWEHALTELTTARSASAA